MPSRVETTPRESVETARRTSLRVVRIIARLNVGGPARHVTWLNAGLNSAGHECSLVVGTVPPGEGDMTWFARQHGVEPIVIPEMSREVSLQDAITVWKLFRLLARLEPDVVHTHTAKAGTLGRLAVWLYRWCHPAAWRGRPRVCRVVHTYHGHIFHSYYGRWKTRLFLAIERFLARLTDRIVVISPQQYREIHEQYRVGRPEQLAVVPLGLDLDAFDDWPQRRREFRDVLDAGPDEVLVGIVGRLTEVKNHAMFLQAAACCRQQLAAADSPRVRFVIVGDGHLWNALRSQSRRLGLEEHVQFLGTRDDPENFVPAFDIVALTSRNEGTPLTLLEAMANARPIVATAAGGVVDLLGEPTAEQAGPGYRVCRRGVLVNSHQPADFARALRRLIHDLPLQQQLGSRGRAFVEQNYSKQRLVDAIAGLYGELSLAEPAARCPRPIAVPYRPEEEIVPCES